MNSEEIHNRVLEAIEECFYRTPRSEMVIQMLEQINIRTMNLLIFHGEFSDGLRHHITTMLQSKLNEYEF